MQFDGVVIERRVTTVGAGNGQLDAYGLTGSKCTDQVHGVVEGFGRTRTSQSSGVGVTAVISSERAR